MGSLTLPGCDKLGGQEVMKTRHVIPIPHRRLLDVASMESESAHHFHLLEALLELLGLEEDKLTFRNNGLLRTIV